MVFASSICGIFEVFLQNSLKTPGAGHSVALSRRKSGVPVETPHSPAS